MGLTCTSGWRPRARLVSIGAGSAEIFLSLLAASFRPDFYRFRLQDRTDLWSVINAPLLKRRHPVVSLLATSVSRPATCRRRGSASSLPQGGVNKDRADERRPD